MKKTIITILIVCLTVSLIGEFTQNTILAKTPLFRVHYFNSVPALYVELRDFSSSRLRDIHAVENQRMEDTIRRTHVTDDERINGMFGSLRNRLLRERTVLVPYYQGKEVFFGTLPDGMGGDPGITLHESELFLKPWINYSVIANRRNLRFRTMYFDRNLLDEANEKGASWLLRQISPGAANVHNYEEHQIDGRIITVYEKKIKLGDRDVLALIRDTSMFFVYDDILVLTSVSETMEAFLPDITFQEVSLSTGRPTRNRPGREGSQFSTREVLILGEIDTISIAVMLNNQYLAFEQPPVVENNRILVPMRTIFEAIGADVEWDSETQTVTAKKDDIELTLLIDSELMTVNGQHVTLDVPPKLIGGRTLVPVRAISEGLGAEVEWDDVYKRVIIESPDIE